MLSSELQPGSSIQVVIGDNSRIHSRGVGVCNIEQSLEGQSVNKTSLIGDPVDLPGCREATNQNMFLASMPRIRLRARREFGAHT
jgi:hypothetical protein